MPNPIEWYKKTKEKNLAEAARIRSGGEVQLGQLKESLGNSLIFEQQKANEVLARSEANLASSRENAPRQMAEIIALTKPIESKHGELRFTDGELDLTEAYLLRDHFHDPTTETDFYTERDMRGGVPSLETQRALRDSIKAQQTSIMALDESQRQAILEAPVDSPIRQPYTAYLTSEAVRLTHFPTAPVSGTIPPPNIK